MAQQETRKQQIARRLRVSERVLEQYLQLKRAEVEDQVEPVEISDARSAEARVEPRQERPSEVLTGERRKVQREKRV
jgi:DNA-binding transcriptional regulator LsrR (DeoR family)